jgi:hypothetical protein
MILLDSNVFYAQVRFDCATDTVTLVKGHGWAFNSGSAWKSVSERWAKETSHNGLEVITFAIHAT